jgi:hypothetical protein
MASVLEQVVDKRAMLESYLDSTTQIPQSTMKTDNSDRRVPKAEEDMRRAPADFPKDMDIERDFPEDMDIDIDYSQFPNLESIKIFLLEGQPFVNFEMRLAQFVYPERHLETPHQGVANDKILTDQADTPPRASGPGHSAMSHHAKLSAPAAEHLQDILADHTSHNPPGSSREGQSEDLHDRDARATSLDTSDSTNETEITKPDDDVELFDELDNLLGDDTDSVTSETEGDERFRNPCSYFQKLADLEAEIYFGSGALMHDSLVFNNSSEHSSLSPRIPAFQSEEAFQFCGQSIDISTSPVLRKHSCLATIQLLDCHNLLLRVCTNLRRLKDASFAQHVVSFLVQDSRRKGVVRSHAIDIDMISQLFTEANSALAKIPLQSSDDLRTALERRVDEHTKGISRFCAEFLERVDLPCEGPRIHINGYPFVRYLISRQYHTPERILNDLIRSSLGVIVPLKYFLV